MKAAGAKKGGTILGGEPPVQSEVLNSHVGRYLVKR
jgi:hypothetical protein